MWSTKLWQDRLVPSEQRNHWDLSGRDVVPDLVMRARPADVGGVVLFTMLASDGIRWTPPYRELRRRLAIRDKQIEPERQEQADSRLRTFLTLFRGLGLVYEEGSSLRVTDLGNTLHGIVEQQQRQVDDFARVLFTTDRHKVGAAIAPCLARYQLANPLSTITYPEGTDVHPILAIWRAMRDLDDKLHWDEFDRTLTTCLRDEDIPDAVARVRNARAVSGYDPRDADMLTDLLGPRMPEVDSQADRVDTWFSRAAFKNLFLEHRDRPDGYRYLNSEFIPLLDEVIEDPPPFNPTTDKSGYVRWLGSAAALQIDDGADGINHLVGVVVDRARRFGGRQLITLVGPAGTGKTYVAHEAALALTGGDTTRVHTVQFHAAFTYEEFVGGLAPNDNGAGFSPKRGTLLEINKLAHQAPDLTHVLVIDELSRADVANVLGELLTYIEYRDRRFEVPAFGDTVSIARNLVIIATMNPADRSVVNMDDALVRRLRQINVPRDSQALRSILTRARMPVPLRERVVDWFKSLPEDVPFGHGLFVGVQDESHLHELWHEELRHFLRRGGITVYHNPEAVENGYIWRDVRYASGSWQVEGTAGND